MDFCEKLLMLRKERGLSQEAVAKHLDITLRQYFRFEKGEQKPGFDNLRKIAVFYDVSTDWLFGRTEQRTLP